MGAISEIAFDNLFGTTIADLSVGDNRSYKKQDLKKLGIDCGLKSVFTKYEADKFPLIELKEFYPQVVAICVETAEPPHREIMVHFLGVAEPQDQVDNCRKALFLQRHEKNASDKYGMFGLDLLKPLTTIEDLRSRYPLKPL